MFRSCLCLLAWAALVPAQELSFGSRYQIQLPNFSLGRLDAAVTADFNQDGVPDIAVPGFGTGVAILTGKGGGDFQTPRFLPISSCWALVSADFDGDGNADLAGTDGGRNAVFVARGDGAGGFGQPVWFPASPTPYRMAIADLNLDSLPDILVTDRNAGTITVLLNSGNGRFGAPIPSPAGTDPTFLATGDFNGDSIPDAVTVNFETRNASLLTGNGDGTFLAPVTIADGTSVYNVTAADFNGDGRLDLAFGTIHEYVHVLLAAEGGGFASGDWYYFGRFAHLTAGDVDGDGRIDLFGVLQGGTAVVVMKGTGDGRFGEPQTVAALSTPSYAVLADINGDQRLDAVVSSYERGILSVLLNPGDGSDWPITHSAGPARPTALATADFDGDGRPDLAFATSGINGVWVARGFGDGTLGTPSRQPAGVGPSALATADFNRDGTTDIAVANADSNNVLVLPGKGDGTFLPARSSPLDACRPTTVRAADFNHDGFADLAVGCAQTNSILILNGRGDGTFQQAAPLTPAGFVARFAVADFNADGLPDIAVLGAGLALYLGSGDGSFRGPVNLPAASGCSDLLAADLNEDSAPDLAALCPGPNVLIILLNLGTGAFRRVELAVQASAGVLAAADLTGDGRTDLVFSQEQTALAIYAGNGNGAFTEVAGLGVLGGISGLALADFNSDGRADLVMLEPADSRVSLLLSSPEGATLQPPVPLSPAAGEAILQNNPASNCVFDPIRGSGIRILFRWTPVLSAAAYTLRVDREGAQRPVSIIGAGDAATVPLEVCTFYPDSELEGWSWRVRWQDAIGNISPWSEAAPFRLSPCRMADGRPCGTIAPIGGQVPMSVARVAHTATLLRNGKVLVAGGTAPLGTGVTTLATAELYDPATRTFAPAPRMQFARAYHTATLLPDGRVLLAGGMNVTGSQTPAPVGGLEIYDPVQGTFSLAGSMMPRNSHTATLLKDGRVLLAGGIPGQGSPLTVAELFDPATGRLTAASPMINGRMFHTATLLADGRVLMVGGSAPNLEFFVPSSNSFVSSPVAVPRMNHSANLLPDGRVLITGGNSSQGPGVVGAVLFDPSSGTLLATGAMLVPRADHSATSLADGRVLLLGGRSNSGEAVLASEIYVPATRAFSPGPPVTLPRVVHTATLLGNGTILVTGGFQIVGGASSWVGTAELVGPLP